MKKIYYFSLLFLISVSCKQTKQTKQSETNEEAKKQNLIALNIQYAKTYEYEYKFGDIDTTSGFLVMLKEFDKNGNLVRIENYHKNEYLKKDDKIEVYSYDTIHGLIETTVKDNAGAIKRIIKNKYSGDLNTERFFYNQNEILTGKVVYKHDKNGNCIEYISYGEDGKVEGKTHKSYDSNNKLVGQKDYDNQGKLVSFTKVNENKDKREVLFSDVSGGLEYKDIYHFDENGFVKFNEYRRDDFSIKYEYKYNKDNLIIEKIIYENQEEPTTIEKTEYIKFK
ncbi:MAG: hypothetical protein FWC39_06285 [Bacteroidetes bacterium]|nr:hypothetical protein [Bacteroidota bacterium]